MGEQRECPRTEERETEHNGTSWREKDGISIGLEEIEDQTQREMNTGR